MQSSNVFLIACSRGEICNWTRVGRATRAVVGVDEHVADGLGRVGWRGTWRSRRRRRLRRLRWLRLRSWRLRVWPRVRILIRVVGRLWRHVFGVVVDWRLWPGLWPGLLLLLLRISTTLHVVEVELIAHKTSLLQLLLLSCSHPIEARRL